MTPPVPSVESTPAQDPATEARIDELIGAMTLEEKASLTAGVGLWYLPPVERLGIPALKVSDGPSGVRGDSLIGRRSLSLPCGMAIGSTWNEDLVGRLGEVLAAEAVSKGVHVLLGPTVCIVRTPLAGRTFESYSEDPHLTARLAVAYVRGVQGGGVACCIKHFACNDQEYERMTISAEVDERTLHEIHLVAFECAVKEAGVWAIMTSYNRVNGLYGSEQATLIDEVLRSSWGFDGLVMSDWFGTHSTVPAAEAGLDLEMPGPSAWFAGTLADAVRRGEVDEAVVDGQVRHLLRLMGRVGILGDGSDRGPAAAVGLAERQDDDPGRRAVARQVVVEGTVLLKNDGLLPLDASSGAIRRVAVIGPNAGLLEGGGGSSEVTPHRRVRLHEAIAARLPGAEVVYEVGCRIGRELPTIDMDLVSGGDGLDLEFFDNVDLAGEPVASERAHNGRPTWVGDVWPGMPVAQSSVRVRGSFVPDVSGRWQLGLESAGRAVWKLDGEVVVDNSEPARGKGFFGGGSTLVETEHELEAGRAYALEVELRPSTSPWPILGVRLAAQPPLHDDEMAAAVAAARDAGVAVVVVGSNGSWESEGFDRPDLSLPGRQRELIEAVAAVNPRTVVVVNAGSPVEMGWADDPAVGAVLVPWYPGEEGADGIADMLVGLAEPSGRLPVTIPRSIEDTPAFDFYPGADDEVVYGEGILVGYRHYDTRHVAPHFPFGHGLSYTSFAYGSATVDGRRVRVEVTNTGERAGTEVVQFYVRALDAVDTVVDIAEVEVNVAERPDRELAAFVKVSLEAGETAPVEVELTEAAFSYWDLSSHGWKVDPGHYDVLIGSSSRQIRAEVVVEVALP
jgi:beta-glucosidase